MTLTAITLHTREWATRNRNGKGPVDTLTDMGQFAPYLCAALGVPSTPGRIQFLTEWARFEGTNALWNPLATTLDSPALELPGTDATGRPLAWFNDVKLSNGMVIHVMNYRDLPSGVQAIAQTIKQSNFAVILQSLQQEQVLPGVAACIRSTWGTTGFANELDAGWAPSTWAQPAPQPPPAPAYTPDQLILIALFAGSEQKDATGAVLPLDQRLAYAQGRLQEIVSGSKPSLVELAGDALVMASAAATPLANVYGDMARAASQFAAAVQAAGAARVP